MDPVEKLIERAWEVRKHAYAPYSNFSVGAALLSEDGSIFCGANVENLSFGLTICAERSALVAAVSIGHRRFSRIAIVSDSKVPISPCGACRQALAEFSPQMEIISQTPAGKEFQACLADLLPRATEGILG